MELSGIVTGPNEIIQVIQNELDRSKKSLSEVTLLLEQSQAEISKLVQRNAAITLHLQQIQDNLDSAPKVDIRKAYDTALDVQNRLLIMRGQIDKLQADQTNHFKDVTFLGSLLIAFKEFISGAKPKNEKSPSSIIEMLIGAQESERKKLSRQMHDGPAQTLSNFIIQADIAARFFDIDPVKSKNELNNLKESALSTFKKVKNFIFDLRPMMLDDLGLFPTIDRYIQSFKDQYGVDITLSINGKEKRFDSYLEVFIFRTIQELVGNAAKHNNDSPEKIIVNINVNIEENFLQFTIRDNGKGFDPELLSHDENFSLNKIRERLEILGGSLEVNSNPGQGSKIMFQIPM